MKIILLFSFFVSFLSKVYGVLKAEFCNQTFFLTDNTINSLFLEEVYYGVLNNSDYINTKSKFLQVLVFVGRNANSNRFFMMMDLYTRKNFMGQQKDGICNLKIANGEIAFSYGTPSCSTFTKYSKNKNYGSISLPNGQKVNDFVWVDELQTFLIIGSENKQIYDTNKNTYIVNQDDIDLVNQFPLDSFSKILYDPIHSDLYLSIGKRILVFDLKKKRFWFMFTGHAAQVSDFLLINSTIPDKFCVVSIEKNNLDYYFRRWAPSFSSKSSQKLEQSSTHSVFLIEQVQLLSIAKVFRGDILVLATRKNSLISIYIVPSDFRWATSFIYTPSNPDIDIGLVGEIEDTDIFYVFEKTSTKFITRYSIFSSYPNCAMCNWNYNLYFYPLLGGCALSCDRFNRKNAFFCEPNCESQTCITGCTPDNECHSCDENAYLKMTRFYNPLDCLPKYESCKDSSIPNQYLISINQCHLCHSTCQTCIGDSQDQCLSCTGNESYYDFQTATCKQKYQCNQYIENNTLKICYSGKCPYGSFTTIGSTALCEGICDKNCETCDGNALNCSSCGGDKILFENNTCIDKCPQGYYLSWIDYEGNPMKKCSLCSQCPTNYICTLQCSRYNCQFDNCMICGENNTCLTCGSSYYLLEPNTCLQECPIGYYEDEITKKCVKCFDNCEVCIDGTSCKQCKENSYYYSKLAQNSCQICNTSCRGCKESPDNCLACQSPLHYLDMTSIIHFCMEKCNQINSYPNETSKTCEACELNCYGCEGIATNCTGCRISTNEPLFLLPNKTPTASNTFFCGSCPENNGYSLSSDQRNCLACPENCKICDAENDNSCTECIDEYGFFQGNCTPCDISCSKCQTDLVDRCSVCKNTSLYLDRTTGICYETCPPGTYNPLANPKECYYCFEGCKNCTNIAENCTVCQEYFYLKPSKIQSTTDCVQECGSGFVLNKEVSPNQCEKCPNFCANCSNSTYCTTCVNGYYSNASGYCFPLCNAGQYLDSFAENCQNCSSPCKTCNYNSSFCMECEQNYYFSHNKCYDQCPKGTFMQYSNSTNCSDCESSCADCQSPGNYCTSCVNDSLVIVEGSCVLNCKSGWVFSFEQKNCVKCPQYCLQCDRYQKCLLCEDNYSLKDDGFCYNYCGNGYYPKEKQFNSTVYGSVCDKCPPNCLQCEDFSTCLRCDNSLFLYEDGSCRDFCSDGLYEIKMVDNKGFFQYCNVCSTNCETCKNNKYNCTTCKSLDYLMKLENNTNTCSGNCTSDGYYIDLSIDKFLECKPCPENCKSCSLLSGACSECNSGYRLTSRTCQIRCSDNYFIQNNECVTCNLPQYIYEYQPNQFRCTDSCLKTEAKYSYLQDNKYFYCVNCTENCLQCSNSSLCEVCSDGFKVKNSSGLCEPICNEGSFLKDSTCQKCDPICKACFGEARNCTSCYEGFYFNKGSYDRNTCIECDSSCMACQDNYHRCTSCNTTQGYVLINNTCILKRCAQNCTDCQIMSPNNCSQCEAGYNLINNSCVIKTCSENCMECSDYNFNYCEACNSGYKLYQGQCYKQCPNRTYAKNSYLCEQCGENCKNCSLLPGECSQCDEEFYLSTEGDCVKECNSDEFVSQSGISCSKCHENCLTCYGSASTNCLSCYRPFYLRGTTCMSPCEETIPQCSIAPEEFTIELVKSPYINAEFYIVFSVACDVPEYVNLKKLVNLEINNVNSSIYDYEVYRVPENNKSLLIKLNFSQSIANPLVSLNFTDEAKNYLHGIYNVSLVYDHNNSKANLTLETIFVSSESAETKKIKKEITYNTFSTFAYLLLSFSMATYLFESKRMSIFWLFVEFIQFVALMRFLNMTVDERLLQFYDLLFVFHGDFIIYIGKEVNFLTGFVSYFGHIITENFSSYDFLGIFKKILGTNSFMANGFNAFFLVLAIHFLVLLLKYYLILHEKIFNTKEPGMVYGVLDYFYTNSSYSVLIRVVQFFFYIIIMTAFIQFYAWDLKNEINKLGVGLSILALFYYLFFFIWLSKKVINNKEIYESESERWKYDTVFHDIETKYFISRNHFIFLHMRKFFLIIILVTILTGMTTLVTILLIIQLFFCLRYLKYRPFKSAKMNLLNFLTEVGLFTIICILLAIAQNQINHFEKQAIISDDLLNSLAQSCDAIISFVCIVLVMYFIVASILLAYYLCKNIDCICFFFFHQKLPEEEEIMESIDEKFKADSFNKEENRYKIPKRKDLREIAEEEEKKKKYLQEYKKEHIIKIG